MQCIFLWISWITDGDPYLEVDLLIMQGDKLWAFFLSFWNFNYIYNINIKNIYNLKLNKKY